MWETISTEISIENARSPKTQSRTNILIAYTQVQLVKVHLFL